MLKSGEQNFVRQETRSLNASCAQRRKDYGVTIRRYYLLLVDAERRHSLRHHFWKGKKRQFNESFGIEIARSFERLRQLAIRATDDTAADVVLTCPLFFSRSYPSPVQNGGPNGTTMGCAGSQGKRDPITKIESGRANKIIKKY